MWKSFQNWKMFEYSPMDIPPFNLLTFSPHSAAWKPSVSESSSNQSISSPCSHLTFDMSQSRPYSCCWLNCDSCADFGCATLVVVLVVPVVVVGWWHVTNIHTGCQHTHADDEVGIGTLILERKLLVSILIIEMKLWSVWMVGMWWWCLVGISSLACDMR